MTRVWIERLQIIIGLLFIVGLMILMDQMDGLSL